MYTLLVDVCLSVCVFVCMSVFLCGGSVDVCIIYEGVYLAICISSLKNL